MIPDNERKILNILSNFSTGRHRMPTIYELKIKTGLVEGVLRYTIKKLADKNFVEWNGADLSTLKLDPGWRRYL